MSFGIGKEAADLVSRDRGIVLGNLLNWATKLVFFNDLRSGNSRSLHKWNAALFSGHDLNEIAISEVHVYTPLLVTKP